MTKSGTAIFSGCAFEAFSGCASVAGKEEFAYSLGCFAYVKIFLRLTITRYVL